MGLDFLVIWWGTQVGQFCGFPGCALPFSFLFLISSFVAIVFSHRNCLFCSREKIRPERELQRAEAQILRSKLAIREAVHELDDMGLEGSLDENLFDAEGRIYHEEVYVSIYADLLASALPGLCTRISFADF